MPPATSPASRIPTPKWTYKTSGGQDTYNAMQLSLARRLSSGLTMNFQYTMAKSYGNTAGSNEAQTAANSADAHHHRHSITTTATTTSTFATCLT